MLETLYVKILIDLEYQDLLYALIGALPCDILLLILVVVYIVCLCIFCIFIFSVSVYVRRETQ